MQKTNVQFSPHEMELMADPAWILTKNRVMQKMAEGMGSLAARMKQTIGLHHARLPGEIVFSNAKISKGENYQGLPYLMLDYPRLFSRDDILAIRTFFWWGHFCSITLHVKGEHKAILYRNISSAKAILVENKFYCSVGGDEWNHDVRSGDYIQVENCLVSILANSPFIKLSAKVDMKQWEEMEEQLFERFEVLMKLLVWS